MNPPLNPATHRTLRPPRRSIPHSTLHSPLTALSSLLPLPFAICTRIEYHGPHEHTTPIPKSRPSGANRAPPATCPDQDSSTSPPPLLSPLTTLGSLLSHPVIPASAAGTQQHPTPSPTVVPRLTQPPSSSTLPSSRHVHPRSSSPGPSPSSTDSPNHQKNRLKLSLASRPPLGAGWPERAPPFSPRHPAPPRPTVTLTPRTPKAREGCADGRRNHRPRG